MRCIERRTMDSRSSLRVAAMLSCLVGPAAGADSIGLGFPSVQAAYTALSSLPDVAVSEQDGWVRLESSDETGFVAWSFLLRGHPASPAVVRRDVVARAGIPTLVTRFVCEGHRAACEALYERLRADDGEP